jgi:phosphoribosylformylglycinamidine synthase
VIGICNGFQILCEAGLLPGALVRNQGLHYVSRPVAVRVERVETIVTRTLRHGQVLRIPVGHGEGRYVAPPQVLAELEAEDCVVLRYRNGFLDAPANPNGSARDIAAICNPAGTVVGLMPHPERLADPLLDSDAGAEMFYSIVASLAGNPARPNRDTPHEHRQAQS